MQIYNIIAKKRDGNELSREEIDFITSGAATGNIPDYQLSALLMAMYIRGLSLRETADLTQSMAASGQQLDLSRISGIKVDKHSTGGVGDKTTLIAAPLAAAVGVVVAKLSGRGLGHTGGTVDKLQSIPGFKTTLAYDEFITNIKNCGIAIAGQSGNICPADKALYALRDVTATVSSIPLIASSVMSKKLASGADAFVLDIKAGSGAFMDSEKKAIELADTMVAIAKSANKGVVAIISDMDTPLGYCVGNSLEVIEAVEVLKGEGPEDLRELSVTLAAHMAVLAGKASNTDEAKTLLNKSIENGSALNKFKQLIENQGGDTSFIEDYSQLPQARTRLGIYAQKEGYVTKMDSARIGEASLLCGAGRINKDDVIDHGAGIRLYKKTGDYVKKGELIARAYTSKTSTGSIAAMVHEAYSITAEKAKSKPLIIKIIV